MRLLEIKGGAIVEPVADLLPSPVVERDLEEGGVLF